MRLGRPSPRREAGSMTHPRVSPRPPRHWPTTATRSRLRSPKPAPRGAWPLSAVITSRWPIEAGLTRCSTPSASSRLFGSERSPARLAAALFPEEALDLRRQLVARGDVGAGHLLEPLQIFACFRLFI